LGLCITKEIIEQHGDSIATKSCGLGKGATFIIELPLYRFPHEEPNDMKLSTEGAMQLDQTDNEAVARDDFVSNMAGMAATSNTNASTFSTKQIQKPHTGHGRCLVELLIVGAAVGMHRTCMQCCFPQTRGH